MLRRLKALRALDNERGATAVEYALMVTLIAVVIIGAAMAIGTKLIPIFTTAASSV